VAKASKVIISCAVTGSIHTPSMSPHLPITAEEITDAAVGAAEAGAAIVHLHARDPKDGRPDQSPEAFGRFLKVIKQRSAAVVNITTGGSPIMSIEERVRPAAEFKPEVASLNMGTMNFALFPMLARYKEFKYEWEKPYLEGSHAGFFKNTFADIEYILKTCAENGTRFEIECYDIGHLYTLAYFLDRGILKPPMLVQSVFGILGGIGPHPEDVMHMRRTADRLLGNSTIGRRFLIFSVWTSVTTSMNSSSVPKPPGSATKPSEWSAIAAFLVCIESVTINSVSPRWATSRSTSDCGMNPSTSPPATSAASATMPISPTRPPP
jgi:uncharacterized protein (DUF849 family)